MDKTSACGLRKCEATAHAARAGSRSAEPLHLEHGHLPVVLNH
jgi:hypothetical protein